LEGKEEREDGRGGEGGIGGVEVGGGASFFTLKWALIRVSGLLLEVMVLIYGLGSSCKGGEVGWVTGTGECLRLSWVAGGEREGV